MSYNLCRSRPDEISTWKTSKPPPAPMEEQVSAVPVLMDVLLVEGDVSVRETLGSVLGNAGWWVGEAVDAAEALDRTAFDGMPGVLVTDLVLGRGMGGLALVAAARLRWPHLPAVPIGSADMAEPELGPGDRFLRKPFDADALTRAVSDLVAGRCTQDRDHAAA